MRTLDYCNSEDTPERNSVVIYLDGAKSADQWIEVNAAEGWGIKYSEPFECVGEVAKTDHVEGNFGIYILYGFEIHLEYSAETIAEARQKMIDIMGYIGALGEGPDSNCMAFSHPDDQAEYETILREEGAL